jgi:lipoate-protein ligase A
VRCILLTGTDPAENLAAEEWLLANAATDVFMLWRNARAVIVGRNQNTLSQIDEAFVRERGIPVVRRLTGGGAVFHDLGNVNFTFIALGQTGRDIDFGRFTRPIVAALGALGVACAFEGRNDLVIDGRKISGNAQHVAKDRVLHHGTLLYAADMADLSGALRVHPSKFSDKAVRSIPKRVTNIAAHLPEPLTVTEFMARLMAHVSAGAPLGSLGLDPDEEAAIARLAEEKYRAWEWNYGSSPRYGFTKTSRTPGGLVEVHLDVADGVIRDVRLFGDFFGIRDIAGLEALLRGCRHDRESLARCLADQPLGEYLRGVELPVLLECLF